MKNIVLIISLMLSNNLIQAQQKMTPELLWQVKRLNVLGLNEATSTLFYKVIIPNIKKNDYNSKYYRISVNGGETVEIKKEEVDIKDKNVSADGKYKLFDKEVHLEDIKGNDVYKDLKKADVYIYSDLDIRHWDSWNVGNYKHLFYKEIGTEDVKGIDVMPSEPYYTPQQPFGGDEDYCWSPDGRDIYYVSKKLKGKEYSSSTNTDIYKYNLQAKTTENISKANKGYDTNPAFSSGGALAWLQMKTPGYESDKNDIVVLNNSVKQNLTERWDGTVISFLWAKNGKELYFTAPIDGTIQIFKVNYSGRNDIAPVVEQLSNGQFDIINIISQDNNNNLLVTRTDMNHAAEIFSFKLNNKTFKKLTSINDKLYSQIKLPKVEKRYISTTDDKKMLVWVIFPPNFDASKKYPTLLYTQGGPQAPLSQFYSYRWNFQLMASKGYIVVAPNRRGMPGFGVKWNEEISQDWGGQAMDDYLSAIDEVVKESYVDNNRLGAVGASYGGYSVFYLAGIHNKRFKTFIAHDGVFDTRSMYGTTEELFFVNHDFGGPYWEKGEKSVQKAFHEFNPISMVSKWDTPILIIQGGKDYRVPIEQGLSAFQAAQQLKIKSKLLYFPDENHWVLKPQNALIWQYEFFKWLKETL